MKKKFTSTFIVFSLLVVTALSLNAQSLDAISKSKTIDPKCIKASDGTGQTDVTFSFPAQDKKTPIDVVFVLDYSNSTNFQAVTSTTLSMLSELKEAADINVGIVKFHGLAKTILPLTPLKTPADSVQIRNAITGIDMGITLSTGTNIHGGLQLADTMLQGSLSRNPNIAGRQFVILITDAKANCYNNENYEQTIIYSQFATQIAKLTSDKIGLESQPTWSQSMGRSKYSVSRNTLNSYYTGLNIVEFFEGPDNSNLNVPHANDGTAYRWIHNSTNPELTGTHPYAHAIREVKLNGNVTEHPINNISSMPGSMRNSAAINTYYEFTPSAANADVPFMQLNPYVVVSNSDGSYSYDYTQPNPHFFMSHVDALEKSLYMAGHLFEDMSSRYNTVMLWDSAKSFSNVVLFARSFAKWLLSEESGRTLGMKIGDRPVADFVNDLKDILVDLGEDYEVYDTIADHFELNIPSDNKPFTISYDGTTLACVPTGSNSWGFGTPDAGVYPYEITYNASTKSFKWQINAELNILHTLQLVYTLDADVTGLPAAEYPTNSGAYLKKTITPTSGAPVVEVSPFEVPTMKVLVPPCTEATDFEGRTYTAKRIGSLCWMTENLKSKKYSDGTPIPDLMRYYSAQYPNEAENEAIFGNLYFLPAALRSNSDGSIPVNAKGFVQGACPKGWRLPFEEDFATLDEFNMKDLKSTGYWVVSDGTNLSGFNILPSGYYNGETSRFEGLYSCAYFCTVKLVPSPTGSGMIYEYYCDSVIHKNLPNNCGVSIRCIKEDEDVDCN